MIQVYGCRISYYTGKLETYLRFRKIPYEQLPTEPHARRIRAGAGAVQMPVVELEDGRWLSDSTPIIAWYEGRQEAPSIYPGRSGASLRSAPARRLRRRMALATRHALSLELCAGSAIRERRHRR